MANSKSVEANSSLAMFGSTKSQMSAEAAADNMALTAVLSKIWGPLEDGALSLKARLGNTDPSTHNIRAREFYVVRGPPHTDNVEPLKLFDSNGKRLLWRSMYNVRHYTDAVRL